VIVRYLRSRLPKVPEFFCGVGVCLSRRECMCWRSYFLFDTIRLDWTVRKSRGKWDLVDVFYI